MSDTLQQLSTELGHTFKNPELLIQALTHRSFDKNHNERLEFLGDATLGFIISSELFQQHKRAKEGSLSQMRASLVRRETLADLARKKGILNHLHLGPGEKKRFDELNDSILADAMEAIIGAIYLDAGIDTCRQCVINWYNEMIARISQMEAIKDSKTQLQEWLQAHRYPLPSYKTTQIGKDNSPIFKTICTVEKLPHQTEGRGNTRRKAEQLAASRYLEQLHERK